MTRSCCRALALAGALALGSIACPAFAMDGMSGMEGMDMNAAPSMETGHDHMDHGDMGGMGHDMMVMDEKAQPMMSGAAGNYPMTRDASGTSWQPDSAPMEGVHGRYRDWTTMLHGQVLGVYDHQGGPRGDDKVFSESMIMGMAQREAGPGRLTLRAMLSLDPLMGKRGYPLLLQTGETADGRSHLVDRQHPHDFLMELAALYSYPVSATALVFGYIGYPGEPALGPPAFMHRYSGLDNPAAPLSHHWLDSTHITFGVVTLGVVQGPWKIEGSLFNGREPDENRWDFERFDLDSASARLSWNPTPRWSLQASYGFLQSPEQLEPDVDQHRVTASASYNVPLAQGNWQTTLAWGRNVNSPGDTLDAVLLESAIQWSRHTVFTRVENAQKDELFEAPDPFADDVHRVSSASLGYVYDIPLRHHLLLGVGAVGTVAMVPDRIEPAYGSNPLSCMLFVRLKIGD